MKKNCTHLDGMWNIGFVLYIQCAMKQMHWIEWSWIKVIENKLGRNFLNYTVKLHTYKFLPTPISLVYVCQCLKIVFRCHAHILFYVLTATIFCHVNLLSLWHPHTDTHTNTHSWLKRQPDPIFIEMPSPLPPPHTHIWTIWSHTHTHTLTFSYRIIHPVFHFRYSMIVCVCLCVCL